MRREEVTVADLGRVVTGKTPSTKTAAFFEGDYPFVTPSDLDWRAYYCQSTERMVSGDARAAYPNQFVPADSVMVTCIGNTIGKCALAASLSLTNQQINTIVPRENVPAKFVYYLLIHHTELIRQVGLGGGAATPILNKTDFSRITLMVPPQSSWGRISDILSAYDDLIENNRRRMTLLEDAARQLYREWFVRLRFPGHEHTRIIDSVPEGWERTPLGDRVVLNYGKALKADDRVDGAYPVYGSSGIVGKHNEPLVAGPGIIVGRKGNVGSVYWSAGNYWPIDTVYFVDSGASDLWLYYALQHLHFISTDVAVPGLNRDFAYSRELLAPEERFIRYFLELADPLHEQIANLQEMNARLRAGRDLLLPRLMNGEIAA